MPTQSTTYNTRLTDEALEKRFRDTFRSQGGAELVDDLYASGVIVPVVDFTAAAEGSALRQDLQTAWDFSTSFTSTTNTTDTIITNTGFWQIGLTATIDFANTSLSRGQIAITDGLSSKVVWYISENTGSPAEIDTNTAASLVVFVRSGDSVTVTSNPFVTMNTWTRQIADVYGNFTNPSGFTFS